MEGLGRREGKKDKHHIHDLFFGVCVRGVSAQLFLDSLGPLLLLLLWLRLLMLFDVSLFGHKYIRRKKMNMAKRNIVVLYARYSCLEDESKGKHEYLFILLCGARVKTQNAWTTRIFWTTLACNLEDEGVACNLQRCNRHLQHLFGGENSCPSSTYLFL